MGTERSPARDRGPGGSPLRQQGENSMAESPSKAQGAGALNQVPDSTEWRQERLRRPDRKPAPKNQRGSPQRHRSLFLVVGNLLS